MVEDGATIHHVEAFVGKCQFIGIHYLEIDFKGEVFRYLDSFFQLRLGNIDAGNFLWNDPVLYPIDPLNQFSALSCHEVSDIFYK